MPKMTKEEFNDTVRDEARKTACDAVSHIIKAPNDDADVADQVRDMAKDLDGELQGKVEESVDKALSHRQNVLQGDAEVGQDKAVEMSGVGGGTGRAKIHDQPVAKGLENHWMVAGEKEHVPIGSGLLVADCMKFADKSFDNFGGLNWPYIEEQARGSGHKQLANIVQKNLQLGDFAQGGAAIPPEVAADLIMFLHGNTVIRDLDPVTTELNDQLIGKRVSGTVSAFMRGEGGTANASTPSLDEVRWSENYLVVRVIESLHFARNSPAGFRQMLRDEMRAVAAEKEEDQILNGSGTQNEYTGIANQIADGNTTDRTQASSSDGSTIPEILKDLRGMIQDVHGSSTPVARQRPAFVFQHRTWNGIQAKTDADNDMGLFASMADRDDFLGARVGVTHQLPTTQGTDGDQTQAFYIEMSQLVIADALDVDIRELTEATLTDSDGNNRNLADHYERAIELNHASDSKLRHDTAASERTAVDWGVDAVNTA